MLAVSGGGTRAAFIDEIQVKLFRFLHASQSQGIINNSNRIARSNETFLLSRFRSATISILRGNRPGRKFSASGKNAKLFRYKSFELLAPRTRAIASHRTAPMRSSEQSCLGLSPKSIGEESLRTGKESNARCNSIICAQAVADRTSSGAGELSHHSPAHPFDGKLLLERVEHKYTQSG